MRSLRRLALPFLAFAALAGPAAAQTYPSRPIRIVVPFAAGGSLDIGTRIIARKVGHILGQPV